MQEGMRLGPLKGRLIWHAACGGIRACVGARAPQVRGGHVERVRHQLPRVRSHRQHALDQAVPEARVEPLPAQDARRSQIRQEITCSTRRHS